MSVVAGTLGVADLDICVNNGVVDSAAVVMAILLIACATVAWGVDFAMVVFIIGVLTVAPPIVVKLGCEVNEVLTA